MRVRLALVAIAALAGSPALAQNDTFNNNTRGGVIRQPAEWCAHVGTAYAVEGCPQYDPQRACNDGHLPPAKCEELGYWRSERRQAQTVQDGYDRVNKRLKLGNAWAQANGYRPIEAGPPQSHMGQRFFNGRSNINNGTSFYPGFQGNPGQIVQRPPQFMPPGDIVRPSPIKRPKGLLLKNAAEQAAK